ncbi:MAG TPA: hypothetical protein VEU54_05815 [Steroidobacteraceae bacterium]|nr:hypothetical protein [Steroidobacteraceae bacterium]
MNKLIPFTWVAVLLGVSACDVQVRDTTPAQYQANNDIGMYEVSATTQAGALVTPGSVFVFAIGDNQKVPLSLASDGSGWHGLYSVRCKSSFPLQILAVWRLQGLATRQKVEPPQPQMVKLIEPPLAAEAGFNTSGKPTEVKAPEGKGPKGKAARGRPRGEWQGSVEYRFQTVQVTQITAAHIEPASASAADVAAAKPISVVTPMPFQAACNEPAAVRLASSEQRAHGVLVIDTDDPDVPHWQTKVEFSPK